MKEFLIISLCCIVKNKSPCACKVTVLFPSLFFVSQTLETSVNVLLKFNTNTSKSEERLLMGPTDELVDAASVQQKLISSFNSDLSHKVLM